jgi:hypothetical protein
MLLISLSAYGIRKITCDDLNRLFGGIRFTEGTCVQRCDPFPFAIGLVQRLHIDGKD